MLGTTIIVFREALEACLIISILAAATTGIPKVGRWIGAGVTLGLLGSVMVAMFTNTIASFADGIGQELFNAMVLGVAVTMLVWHSIWMKSHAVSLVQEVRAAGERLKANVSEMSIILTVVSLAVLREGSETVLFLYGNYSANPAQWTQMLTGGLLGLLVASVLGFLMYLGLLRVPLRWFFNVTFVMIALLAAGMASQAAKFLIQADVMPSLGDMWWDSSAWLPEQSILGMTLHTMVGYESQPAGLQVLFYVMVPALIYAGMWLMTLDVKNKLSLSAQKLIKKVSGEAVNA